MKKHLDQAISLADWVSTYKGKSYNEIITEAGWKDGMSLGPKKRYVVNPNDGNVMDMRHVTVVGFLVGTEGGKAVEEVQNLRDVTRGSAYDPQDYYSNEIGARFVRYYWSNILSSSNWATLFNNYLAPKNANK